IKGAQRHGTTLVFTHNPVTWGTARLIAGSSGVDFTANPPSVFQPCTLSLGADDVATRSVNAIFAIIIARMFFIVKQFLCIPIWSKIIRASKSQRLTQ
ncbi:MAG: hypothetical protein ACI3XE_00520, partial [Eubacteriales bacterium]